MKTEVDELFLYRKAVTVRLELLEMIYRAGSGHVGGALSSVDLLVVLFYAIMRYRPEEPDWPERDRFILSKGHSCEGYYVILADRGFFPREELQRFMKFDALLMGHPSPKIPGVEIATGSLGHGLSTSVGIALAGKMDSLSYRVYCLMGDGEMTEGSVWEAAMAAAHYRLDNLVCIVDRNGLQISGPTQEVMNTEPLSSRWKAFGWETFEIDGHDIRSIRETLLNLPRRGKPTLVIANTVKGKGVSFMEGDPRWHHRVPSEEEFRMAVAELKGALARLDAFME
ncbi:MAG: transketolase [Firmicutes bacterium]|nr:transketolase [Bacillota bacterium]